MAEKQIRENRLITTVVIAQETGLSLPSVYRWVNDELQRFDSDGIVTLCEYFNCRIEELLVIEDNPESIS
jgi:DNA-binding Xre family transcriptional regulator